MKHMLFMVIVCISALPSACTPLLQDGETLAEFLRRQGASQGTERRSAMTLEEEIAVSPKAIPTGLRREGLQGRESRLTLEECLQLALYEHDDLATALARREIAQALHRQAGAAYWPQISGRVYASMMGREPKFGVPAFEVDVPGGSLRTNPVSLSTPSFPLATSPGTIQTPAVAFTTPPTTVSTPASIINVPGLGAVAVPSQQAAVPAQTINVPAQSIDVPSQTVQVPAQQVVAPSQIVQVPDQRVTIREQEISLADNLTRGASLDVTWLLADGGERSARRRQARAGIEAARQGERRIAVELLADVSRYYHAAVASRQARDLADEMLEQMDVALDMTRQFYEGESLTVTKMDYLRNAMLVEAYRATREELAGRYHLSCAALTHVLGLDWSSLVEPSSSQLPPLPVLPSLADLVADGYQFSPDWGELLPGLNAAEEAVREARSGHFPKLAFQGSLYAAENGLDTGLSTSSVLNNWQVGIGVEIPLFSGFLTRGKVAEARARLEKMQSSQLMLKRGLGTRIRKAVLLMDTAGRRKTSFERAAEIAAENELLTEKAYAIEMAETDDLFEAIFHRTNFRGRAIESHYEALEARSEIDAIVGGAFADLVSELMEGRP